jgi:DNA-binding transcriptional ArsR family regulator
MLVEQCVELSVSAIGAAIGEPARARILFSLLGGHARTSTELAIVADVSPSTASMHLARLKQQNLIAMVAQGKHRYYRLQGSNVAAALEALTVCAGGAPRKVPTRAPSRLRAARSCYDHMAGQLGVQLHDRLRALGWLVGLSGEAAYDLTGAGAAALAGLGIDLGGIRALRRRFAYGCVDWSERRPHLGGALGAALLTIALKRRWLARDLDDRALTVTSAGRREMRARFGVSFAS